jgi:hypothetical protein
VPTTLTDKARWTVAEGARGAVARISRDEALALGHDSDARRGLESFLLALRETAPQVCGLLMLIEGDGVVVAFAELELLDGGVMEWRGPLFGSTPA